MKEVIAYLLGGMGFLHELIIAQAERPFLLTASLALMGFPLVFKAEEKLKKSGTLPEGEDEKDK